MSRASLPDFEVWVLMKNDAPASKPDATGSYIPPEDAEELRKRERRRVRTPAKRAPRKPRKK